MYQVFNSYLWPLATMLDNKRNVSIVVKSSLMSEEKLSFSVFCFVISIPTQSVPLVKVVLRSTLGSSSNFP